MTSFLLDNIRCFITYLIYLQHLKSVIILSILKENLEEEKFGGPLSILSLASLKGSLNKSTRSRKFRDFFDFKIFDLNNLHPFSKAVGYICVKEIRFPFVCLL